MKIRHSAALLGGSFLVALVFDQLFWKQAPGISFPVLVALLLAFGFLTLRREGQHPARASLPLALFAPLFAALSAARAEPFTRVLCVLLCAVCLLLLDWSFTGGRWPAYDIPDHGTAALRFAASLLTRPFRDLSFSAQGSRGRTGRAVLRGLLLAVPVVFLFALLLAQADPVFSQSLRALLRIESPGELLFRLVYILVLGYLLSGALLHAIADSADSSLSGIERPGLARFLGFIEAAVLLGALDLLFAFFTAIQFRYLFGGDTNIRVDGFTYAEYARRGFNELAFTAVLVLALLAVLHLVTRREGKREARVYSALAVGLVLLTGVVLASAAQRLTLYESAYGLSRLRTYTHLLLPWIGLLLAGTAALEIAGRTRFLPLAALVAAAGFCLTLTLLNVDGLIAGQNLRRAAAGKPLDPAYLVTLSADADPALLRHFKAAEGGTDLADQLGAVLACRAWRSAERSAEQRPWTSWNLSEARSAQSLAGLAPQLSAYPVQRDPDGRPFVLTGAERLACDASGGID